MTKYDVHIYRELKLFYPDIEADSPEAAAEIASKMDTDHAEDISDADGVNLSALVDVQDAEDYGNSQILDFEPQRMLNAVPGLLDALRAVLPYAEAELASLQEAQKRDGGLEAEVAACEVTIEQAGQLVSQIEAGAA